MTTFDDRKRSFEKKFANDQEKIFKANARRNKLLGIWAAEMMGMDEEAAKAYAVAVIKADMEEPGDEDVFRKIRADFDAHNVEQTDHQIRHKMEVMMNKAMEQIANEG